MTLLHFRSLLRLFFLKASQNRKTILGGGLYFVMAPLLKKWARSADDLKDLAIRHTGYFNTDPVMASYIIGAVEKMEEERSRGESITARDVEDLKEVLSQLLAARGNYFFSMVLLPLVLTIASLFAIYGSYAGLIIFLAVYNVYHFHYRIGGYLTGLRRGREVIEALLTSAFGTEDWLKNCAALAGGVLAAVALVEAFEWGGFAVGGYGLALVAGGIFLLKKLSFYLYVLISVTASCIFLLLYRIV